MSGAEHLIEGLVDWLKLAAEGAAALVIGVGLAVAVWRTWRLMRRRSVPAYDHLRLSLSRALVLALEFQLASDILGTTWTRPGLSSAKWRLSLRSAPVSICSWNARCATSPKRTFRRNRQWAGPDFA